MTQLHTGEVDGVRTFWVETGRPTLAATLMFRQGMADEQLTTRGWTHLLEHMCLHGRGGGQLAVNGSVSLLTTEFSAHGPAAGVAEHLREVCSWLSDPELASLEHERKILFAESGVRGHGDLQQALTWRYGARGPGLCSFEELGLGAATEHGLRDLASRAFTAANAVLMLDGPPPAELALKLPSGEYQPFLEARPCDDQRPASYHVEQGVVLSGEVTRSTPATFLTRWLDLELQERLRRTAGAAYAPWSHHEPVDRHRAVVLGGSDVSAEHHTELTQGVLDLVERLRHGCDQATLDTMVAEFVQGVSDPYQAYGVALRAGHFALRGDEPETLEQTLDSARAVTTDEIAAAGTELAESLMVGLPAGAERTFRLPELKRSRLDADSYSGTGYRSANAPADGSRLVVDPSAILVTNDTDSVGVRVDRLAGLLKVPDGGRRLVDLDGWGLTVEPTLWRQGGKAVAQIDQVVPPHLHVPCPARDPQDVPQPASARLRYQALLADRTVRVALLGLVFMALLLVGYQLLGRVPVGGVAVMAWALFATWRQKPEE